MAASVHDWCERRRVTVKRSSAVKMMNAIHLSIKKTLPRDVHTPGLASSLAARGALPCYCVRRRADGASLAAWNAVDLTRPTRRTVPCSVCKQHQQRKTGGGIGCVATALFTGVHAGGGGVASPSLQMTPRRASTSSSSVGRHTVVNAPARLANPGTNAAFHGPLRHQHALSGISPLFISRVKRLVMCISIPAVRI